MKIKDRLKELKPVDLNCNVFDVYNYNGLSMQDLLSQFFTKINECVGVSNSTLELAQWLVNEGLSQEVTEKLLLWYEDGTLENIINESLFENLNNKVDSNKSELENKISETNTHLKNIENKIENLDIINVKDFGAIGGGIETAEIDQRAFEEAIKKIKTITSNGDDQTGTCELFIPNGRYYVGGLDIPCGVKIRGVGMWNTILFHNKGSYLIKIVGSQNHPSSMITDLNIRGGYHTGADYSLLFDNRTAVIIKNCWLGANKSILIKSSFDNMITNCVFDIGVNGIEIANAGHVIITNNIFWGVKNDSITVKSSNIITVDSNQFIRCVKNNIKFDDCNDLIISNNIFESDNQTNSAGFNVFINNSTNFIINSNIMTECRCNGIQVDGASKFGKIFNNTIRFNENNSSSAITLLNCSNLDVIYNNIHNALNYDLVSRGSNIKIIGNYIDNILNKSNKGIQNGSCAITITGNNNTLDDNTVISNKNYEFALYVAPNININDKINNFGVPSNYANPYDAVQTTSGAIVKTFRYVDPQSFTTTGATELTGLRDYVNSLVNTLINTGVLKN